MGRCQILLENEISIFKKLVSRRKHEVLQNVLVNGCSDVGFQKTQMDQHQQMTLHPKSSQTVETKHWTSSNLGYELPPDSRTLVSKWNAKLALIWKENFEPLGNSLVHRLLSPGKTPLMTTVAKFLDTSVCGCSWCLDPSLSPFLVKFTQIRELILHDDPHKAAVHSVGCAFFSSTLFPSSQHSVLHAWIQHSVNCLLLWQCMFVAYPPCEGCQWLSSEQLLDHQSSPWLCSLVNQTEIPFWRLRKPLQVFWVD